MAGQRARLSSMLIAYKDRARAEQRPGQATYLARACGMAHLAYSWALPEWEGQYAARQLDPSLPASSETALRRQLIAIKRHRFP